MDPTALREGFIRQRKNLIISSFVLLFAQISQLEIETLNVFGNEIKLKHPYAITSGLIVITFYWAIRYYQHFKELKETGIKSMFRDFLTIYFTDHVIKTVHQNNTHKLNALKKHQNSRFTLNVEVLQAPFHENVNQNTWIGHSAINKTDLLTGTTTQHEALPPTKISFYKSDYFYAYIHASLKLCINTTKFTEYILPFIIFSLPVAYGLYNSIVL